MFDRRIVFSLFLLLSLLTFLTFRGNKGTGDILSSFSVSSTPAPQKLENIADIESNGKTYKVAWFSVDNTDNLSLIPNFDKKEIASNVAKSEDCTKLVNAGFYTKEDQPVALFQTEDKKYRDYRQSSLFNGVLSINDMATPRITDSVPRDNLRIALQTGPILVENGQYKKLAIQNDKPARRVVAVITGENELVFLTMYDPNSFFGGPLLSEVPEILKKVSDKNLIIPADAINLDGGSASVFMTPEITLSEAQMSGSFFCVKE